MPPKKSTKNTQKQGKLVQESNGSTKGEPESDQPELGKRKAELELDESSKVQVDQKRSKFESQYIGSKPESMLMARHEILQQGLIYFFYRPKIDTEEVQHPDDVQRTYIVLSPLPHGTKLGATDTAKAVTDEKSEEDMCILELPKKQMPLAGGRFLTFVAKSSDHVSEIRDRLSHDTKETKTKGTRTTESARPLCEGVYVLARSGRSSHLLYSISKPEDLKEAQKTLGVQKQGSLVISIKNPETPSPPQAQLPKSASLPQSYTPNTHNALLIKRPCRLQDRFRGLRWLPAEPDFLQHENMCVLLIAEKNMKKDDEKVDKAVEELMTLEKEDEERIKHIEGGEGVFVDLGLLPNKQEEPEFPQEPIEQGNLK